MSLNVNITFASFVLSVFCCMAIVWGEPVKIHRRGGEIRQDTLVYKTLSKDYKLVAMVHYPREWRKTDKRPAFVCSYGSGWKGGKYAADPKNETFLSRWEPKCDDMAIKGAVCVRYDYRSPGKKEQFSDHRVSMISDARSIVRWVRQNAGELGVDTGKICGAGGSSGFHIMVSGAVFEDPLHNEPGESPDISPKANALIGFTGALCNSPGKINGICPGADLEAGDPPVLGIIGGKDSWKAGVEKYVEKAYQLHIPAQLKTDPTGGHDFHVGMFGRGSQAGYDSSITWAQNFLFSIGHMDLTLECPPGGKVSLAPLSRAVRDYCAIVDTLGACDDIQYQYAGNGGGVDAEGVFTSNGLPGMYRVTARPGGYPHVSRQAIIRVPVMLPVSAASSLTAVEGFNGVYAKLKGNSGGDVEFTVTHKGGKSAVNISTKSVADGYYYIGAFLFDKISPGGVTVAGNGGQSVDSVMLAPAYTGTWDEELTSVNPPRQLAQFNPAQWDHGIFSVYSLDGKKLNFLTPGHQGPRKKPGHGLIIVRKKQTGAIQLRTRGFF